MLVGHFKSLGRWGFGFPIVTYKSRAFVFLRRFSYFSNLL